MKFLDWELKKKNMKNFIIIISIMAWFNVASQKYYISNSGNDKNNGLTEGTAWKTLDKVNKEMKEFSSGDIIAFKGGDEFYGSVVIDKKNGITLTSYGNGKAIFTGGQDITGWTNIGNNIWESNVKNKVHQVFQNGNVLSQSRFPKIENDYSPLSNYFEVTSKSSNKVFKSSKLIGLPNIVGASVQILSAGWRFTSCKVISFNSGTGQVTLDKAPTHPIDKGDHFFVINHINLLDSNGEWFYDKKSKKLLIKSMSKPTNIVANDLDKIGIDIKSSDRVEVESLSVRYYAKAGLKANKSDNLSVKNSEFLYCYDYGVLTKSSPKSIITHNYVKGGMMKAISLNEWSLNTYVSNSIVSHNTIFEQGILKQATARNFDIPQTIGLHGSGDLMEYNDIQKIGYNGVRIYGSKATVQFNFIKDFCLTAHDGGAIYSQANSFLGTTVDGGVIKNNIIVNRDLGDKWFDFGIYADDRSKNIEILDNTIIQSHDGIYLHNTKKVTVQGNSVYNTREYGLSFIESSQAGKEGEMVGNVIRENDVLLDGSKSESLNFRSIIGSKGFFAFGNFSNNNYWNPSNLKDVHFNTKVDKETTYTLKDWIPKYKSAMGSDQEKGSTTDLGTTVTSHQLVYNKEARQQEISLNGIWEDFDGNRYNGSITLEPFTSKILILIENGTGSIKANAGEDQNICKGESVVLTGSGGTSYVWSNGATTKSITVSPESTKTFTLTAKDGSLEDTDEIIVTVNNVTADAGSDKSIKEGDSIKLTASGGDTYLWSNGETTAGIDVSPLATTKYIVTVTTGDCEDTDEATVTVNKSVSTSITANAGEDQIICKGESVVLTGSGGTSYVWSTGATTKSITVSPESTKIYTLTAKDGSLEDTDEIIITVNNVTADAGADKSIEEGDTVQLTASGGDSYLWSNGETTKSIEVNPLSTTKFTVTVSKGDCEDTDETTVTVTKPSNTIITANAGEDQIICKGESVVLTGSGGTAYVWSTGATTKSITVSPESTKTYTLTAKDGSLEDTDEVIITVNNVTANAGSDKTIEEGESVKLTASGGDTYLWNNGETTKSISVSPLSTIIYSVVIAKNGCEAYDSVKVNVNPKSNSTPIIVNAFAGDDVSICIGEYITLNGTGGDSYSWSTGDTHKNIKVNPTRTTTYTLTASKGNQTDKDTITITVENCSLISELEDDLFVDFDVYPNPSTGIININLNKIKNDLNLVLINLNGNVVYSDKLDSNRRELNKQIDISRFAIGVYFVKLFNSNQNMVKKILLI